MKSFLVAALAAGPALAWGQTVPEQELPTVVVSATPLGAESGIAQPASVLSGARLRSRMQPTLGETLSGEPGVSATAYGPNASRPVIRGLGGERVRIVQNGVGLFDASGTSVDHAVALEPLLLDRIEILRGPAALLYGGAGIGGVVHVMDNRIPREGYSGITGLLGLDAGGSARAQAQAVRLEGGNGRIMFYLDGVNRQQEDLRIPGDARSRRKQAADPQPRETHGILPNSASDSHSATAGSSLVWADGHAGLAYSTFDTRYGTVAEPNVKIGMQQRRFELAGEQRTTENAGWLKTIKFKFAQNHYNHTEYEGSDPATTFKNQGRETRIEFVHQALGKIQGAFGLEHRQFVFSALGSEAFLPTTNNRNRAVFVYEELNLAPLKFSLASRWERSRVASHDDPNFGSAQSRSFGTHSTGVGMQYQFAPAYAFTVNLSASQRAPNYHELFANGAHAATGTFEVGAVTLGREKARGIDLTLRKTLGAVTGSIGVFRQTFANFIALNATGATDSGSGLPIYAYQSSRARISGIEAAIIWQTCRTLALEVGAERLRGDDLTSGAPLARMAPTRVTLGTVYQAGPWEGRIHLQHALAQQRVAPNELPSAGYTLLNVSVSRRVRFGQQQIELFVRAHNLLNQEIRSHPSFLKDVAPAGARSVFLGLRLNLEP